jgi:FHA domain
MSNLQAFPTSISCPPLFLQQYPYLRNLLLADCNHDVAEVSKLLESAFQVSERCKVSAFYIQAIVTSRVTFLMTNLVEGKELYLTTISSSWLIGREATCAITLGDRSISRCHAVIGSHPTDGCYITDLGSSNGTRVNGLQLDPHERQALQDEDILHLGKVAVEFFLTKHRHAQFALQEATC